MEEIDVVLGFDPEGTGLEGLDQLVKIRVLLFVKL